MVLLEARPLQVPFNYDHSNRHFINPDKIVVVTFNDNINASERWVNAKLIDGTEWLIRRSEFNEMAISTDRKGH